MGTLFAQSKDQLCATFVRSRLSGTHGFSYPDHGFGNPDIAAWLAEQRHALLPDEPQWSRLIRSGMLHLPEGFRMARLAELAKTSSIETDRLRSPQNAHEEACLLIVQHLDVHQAMIYCPTEHLQVIVCARSERAVAISSTPCECMNEPHLRIATERDILSAILRCGWGEASRDARAFLCEVLERAIAAELHWAAQCFRTAVAISADGTEAVHADWVVRMDARTADHKPVVTVWPGTAYEETKALRPQRHYDRTLDDAIPEHASAAVAIAQDHWKTHRARIAHHEPSALLIDCGRQLPRPKMYVASAALCPDPLPPGGIEVNP
ncbi:hypothetical protein HY632_03065 [Candidatus Uhrbacteria bacterium]|nr:hypothetical protein [Candidatus Uhrbacteria bacterium]